MYRGGACGRAIGLSETWDTNTLIQREIRKLKHYKKRRYVGKQEAEASNRFAQQTDASSP